MLTTREVIKTFYNALVHKLKKYRGNWDQNDPNADDYIKNRPFYTDETKNKICVKERTFIFDSNGVIEQPNLGYFLIEGETYTVIWDGISYECVARNDGYDGIYIGNQEFASVLMGWDFLETIVSNEPFFIATQVNYNYCCIAAVEGTHKVSIVQPYIVKIDKKYLPENNSEKIEAAIDDLYDYADQLEYNMANIPTDTVRYNNSQNLTDTQKQRARNNIGAGTSNYNDLSNVPCQDLPIYSVHNKIENTFIRLNYSGEVSGVVYGIAYKSGSNEITIGKKYKVVVDGTEIVLEAKDSKNLGNHSLYLNNTQILINPEADFFIMLTNNYVYFYKRAELNSTVYLSIYEETDRIIKKLDEKLLPDGVLVVPATTEDNGKIVGVVNGAYDLIDFTRKYDEIAFVDQVNGYTYIACMRNGNFVTYCGTKSIEITTIQTKTEYVHGEYFEPTGMVVVATAHDGTTREITDYTYISNYLAEGTTSVEITYTEAGIKHTASVPVTVVAFDAATVLVDFEYTDNGNGTYTITGWKGTYNGESSTELIIPNYGCIIL